MARKSDLYVGKLESSGLTVEDGEKLGFEDLSPEEVAKLHPSFKPVPSLKIPYFTPTGKPHRVKPGWPPFYRVRYLKDPQDFASLSKKKPPRYVQEPDSGIAAYFPKNCDWKAVFANREQTIIITEGELKAAKACKEGFPTIGLGGVYNFQSAQLGIPFLPELEAISWVKRKVTIVYDSDLRENGNVCAALQRLATALMERGAKPYMCVLPDVVEGGKTGLDDYLVKESAADLVGVLQEAIPLTLAQPLFDLNDKVIYVRDPGLVVVRDTLQKMSPSQFKEHAFSHKVYHERILKDDGTVSMKPTAAAAHWLSWPMRAETGKLTYEPGRERLIQNNGIDRLNLWPGWGVEPKKGDVKPFLQLLDHLFTGAEKEGKQWFLRWLAFPLQHPGVKMFSSAVLYGIKHGTGKSLVGYTMGRIYGKNFTEITQSDLHASFNEWAESRQFVLGDDVTGSNKRQDADLLKKLITQREMRINQKYIASYVVPDCLNYLWTSNQPDAFFLDDDDRRFFIHEVTVEALPEEFYVDYDLWLDTGGAAAIFDYLLKVDLGDFNPAAPALRTGAKQRMTDDARSDLGSWVRQLREHPEAILKIGQTEMPGDLFTNKQLLMLYDPTGKTGTTANGLGRELRRAGIPQVLGGTPIKTEHGQDRYYVLRNPERWTKTTPEEVKSHLEGKPKRKRKY